VQRGARNGSIIIMHANGRGWHTAEALPQIIAFLRGRGFELVTVSELLGPAPSSPAGAQ
jgi:peptidoglycan/xylan/chitin deacetylase (PgdA/CDA1 family)